MWRGPGRARLAWLVPVLVLEAVLAALALRGDLRSEPWRFVLLYLVAFVAYLTAVGLARGRLAGPRAFAWILGIALLLRATLLPVTPWLSDDIYRYIWDGRVQLAGINPYLHAPESVELEPLRDPLWQRINHPEIPTIYPPGMQAVFAIAAAVSPSVPWFKLVMIGFDLAILLLLRRLTMWMGREVWSLAIYAWNPLVIIEVAGNGHNDVIAAAFLVLALLAMTRARKAWSAAALAAGILAKLFPFFCLPSLVRRTPTRWLWPIPLVVALGYLPVLAARGGLFRGLSEYGHRWQHNDFLFRGILTATTWLDPTEALKGWISGVRPFLDDATSIDFLYSYTHPQYVARAIAFGLMALVAVGVSFRPMPLSREMLVALGAVLLLSPPVHPWYLLWIAPLLAVRPSRGLILWTGLAPLSYALPARWGAEGPPGGVLLWLEYLPVYALLAYDWIAARRSRSTGRPGR